MTTIRRSAAQLLAAGSLLAFSAQCAGAPSFRVAQLASTQDGFAQIVELEEVGGQDGQHQLSGLPLTVTNRAGVAKVFVFPSDLPETTTANRHVMIARRNWGGFFNGNNPVPDFDLPPDFLPTDGGTIDFAGVDRWTFDAIPTDGQLVRRDGELAHGTVKNFAGTTANCCGPVFQSSPLQLGIEMSYTVVGTYYNAALDHYFLTGSQPDIDALESGRITGWVGVSGDYFSASSVAARYPATTGTVETVPVCRYYIPPASHFFSASAGECESVGLQHPEFVLETREAFHVVLPNPQDGRCPRDSGGNGLLLVFVPVYRLWNDRPDTNHRFTTSLEHRAEMIAQGWISEGYGPLGVAWCGIDWE